MNFVNECALGRRKKVVLSIVLGLLNLAVISGLYLGAVVWRSSKYPVTYNAWTGDAYRADENYGHYPALTNLGYHSLQRRERVPVIFDENAFRVPYGTRESAESPAFRILFLGDSFTHGDFVLAEDTFAYLTARELQASALNAGGSGWGLSQMVLRAREAIPTMKPKIVVVQYSNWLPERSRQVYGPSYIGKDPTPYFYESEGRVKIQRPVFRSVILRLRISKHVGRGLLHFVWRVGIPLFLHDDFHVLVTSLKIHLGLLPSPLSSRQRAVDFAYGEIQSLCKANGAEMLILVLSNVMSDRPRDRLDAFTGAVVDPAESLVRGLPEPTVKAWERDYYFWRGDPPQIVDSHPNARMHARIAEVLVDTIRQLPLERSRVGSGPQDLSKNPRQRGPG